jgi:hypothetical protein
MKAMIKEELAPGHEAILFLGKVEQAGGSSRAQLHYRLYDTSPRMKLDELEKAIGKPQTIETRL